MNQKSQTTIFYQGRITAGKNYPESFAIPEAKLKPYNKKNRENITVNKKSLLLIAVCFCFGVLVSQIGTAHAAGIKIGVINGKKVLWTCNAGAKARAKIDAKFKKYQKQFSAEKQELSQLQNDIQKKSSVWSDEKKEEMMLKFNSKKRRLLAKEKDANDDMNQTRDIELQPVIEQIRKGLEKYAEEHGYTVIIDSSSGAVPYFKHSINVTDEVIKNLDKDMTK